MSKVTDKDMGYNALKSVLSDIDGAQLSVGILEGADDEVAVYAASHEFGTDTIPERSFLRSTMDEKARIYANDVTKAIGNVVDGRDIKPELDRLGRRIVSDVQTKIRTGINPPLDDATVDRKGHDTPLIDSGRLINSITHRVDDGGEQ